MNTPEQIIAEHQFGFEQYDGWSNAGCSCCYWALQDPAEILDVNTAKAKHAEHVVAAVTDGGFLLVSAELLFAMAGNPIQVQRDGGEDEPSLVTFQAVPVENLRWLIAGSVISAAQGAKGGAA